MTGLVNILPGFAPITLKELEKWSLLNRTDTKFCLPYGYLLPVLQGMLNHYRCLEIEGKRTFGYSTLYFDTSDFQLYKHHHNGLLNRLKVRQRLYRDSGLCYLETKFKTNKDRTEKHRIKIKGCEKGFNPEELAFLNRHPLPAADQLKPTAFIDYNRITFAGIQNNERLTIDFDLDFRNDVRSTEWHNLVIVELKQDKRRASPFLQIMKEMRIRPVSLSKYCMAVAVLYPEIKHNLFKSKIQFIQNLLSHDVAPN